VSRRPVRRRTPAQLPALAVEHLEELDAPRVIPDDAFLVGTVAWTYGRNEVKGPRTVIGLYQVDHVRELVRPRCTCGWTTEGPTLFYREAVARLDLFGGCNCYGVVLNRGCRCGAAMLYTVLLTHARRDHDAQELRLVTR
jgi:hypothetical protein